MYICINKNRYIIGSRVMYNVYVYALCKVLKSEYIIGIITVK